MHPLSLTGPSHTGVCYIYTLDIQFPNELSREGSMVRQSTAVLLYKIRTLVSKTGSDDDDDDWCTRTLKWTVPDNWACLLFSMNQGSTLHIVAVGEGMENSRGEIYT